MADVSQQLLPESKDELHVETVQTEDSAESPTAHSVSQKRLGIVSRLLPLVSAVISTVLAILLLVADVKSLHFSTDCVNAHSIACWVAYDRTSVAVVVQIIGTVLGFFWTFSVTYAFNLTVRSKLTGKRTNVERLRLYISLSRKAFDLSLPIWALIISVTFYGITYLPPWLWTGCLTPRYIYVINEPHNNTLIADTSRFPMPLYGNSLNNSCVNKLQDNGTFSNCPDIAASGDLINTLSQTTVNRSVFGQAGWTTWGRHYGVGSSVSMLDLYSMDQLTINYYEPGLYTTVNCSYNQSAEWHLSSNLTHNDAQKDGRANMYWADGRRPNDDWHPTINTSSTGYITWDLSNTTPDNVVAFSAGSSGNLWNGTPPYQLSIAAGKQYGFLNATQCDISFIPTMFSVSVDLISYLIEVDYLWNTTLMSNQSLSEMAMRRLQGLTQVGTSLYASTVGTALLNHVLERTGDVFDVTQPSDYALDYVAEAVENVLDDILMGISSYTLTANTTSVNTTATSQYIVIGSPKFHIGLVVINFAALLAIAGVTIWTRAFQCSPAFDFSDLIAMTIAAHNGAGGKEIIPWDGNPKDKSLRKLKLDMRNRIGEVGPPSVMI